MKRRRAASTATLPLAHGPFWSPQIAALSAQLWQPGHERRAALSQQNGWSRTTQQTAATYPSLDEIRADYSAPDIAPQTKRRRGLVEGPQLPTPPSTISVQKHRLKLTIEQRVTLKRWMGAARWTYNQVVAWIRAGKAMDKAGRQAMRDSFLKNSAFPTGHWIRAIPNDVRAGGYRDALDAYDTNMKKRKKTPGFTFEMKYRSKKVPSESIYVCSRAYRAIPVDARQEAKIYPTFLQTSFVASPALPPEMNKDSRLQRTSLGHYYLCIPTDQPVETKAMTSDNQARIIALDPGVRTFQTCYDPRGQLFEFGKAGIRRIERLCKYLDKLQSKLATPTLGAPRRYRMRRAAARLRQRIRDLVNDVHRKTAHFLVTHYDVVLLPVFESQRMVNKNTRVGLASKTARMMLTWAHYRFQQHLIQRGKRSGCEVRLVDEAFTSKTCGACGALHPSLQGAKLFICPVCKHTIDRDANGARNILLRNAALINLDVRPRSGPSAGSLSPGTLPQGSARLVDAQALAS
jgi:putative transposase